MFRFFIESPSTVADSGGGHGDYCARSEEFAGGTRRIHPGGGYSGQMPLLAYFLRYSPGVIPLCFLKTLVKWLWER